MKNPQLVERRFNQIDGKIKTLKFLLSRQATKDEFVTEIVQLEELVNELKSMVDRDTTPLRRG